VHDRLTSLCIRCGLRQPATGACRRCASDDVPSLTDPVTRDEVLARHAGWMLARHERQILSGTSSVRRAPMTFALGGAAVLGPTFGLPLLFGFPLAGVVVIGSSLLVGGAIGKTLSLLSPRSLLGVSERKELDAELARLSADGLPIEVRTPSFHRGETREGMLRGTAAPSPFGGEPLLAARVVGKLGMQEIDDAWIAPGPLTLRRPGARPDEPGAETPLDLEDGAWLLAEPTEPLARDEVGPELDAFLEARGIRIAADGTTLDRGELRVARLRPDARVEVRGLPIARTVSDGYRGATEVVALGGPLRLTWGREP
jgi:hypothetical protein